MNEIESNSRSITVCLSELELHLVEQAASLSGLEVERYARRAILMQTELNPNFEQVIVLSDSEFAAVSEGLEKEPVVNEIFEARMKQKAPWEN